MSLNTLRDNLRDDLKDLDSGDYAWTDAELDRHITRAANEYALSWPLEAVFETAGAPPVSTSTVTRFRDCYRAEFPIDQLPPKYVPFHVNSSNEITVVGSNVPAATETARYFVTSDYLLTDSTSDIPDEHQNIIAGGAFGFAARALARVSERQFTIRRTVGGNLEDAATQSLKEFRDNLKLLRDQRQARLEFSDAIQSPGTTTDGAVAGTVTPIVTSGKPFSWLD